MYAQLGSTIFESLKGFASFSRTASANLVHHAVIEGKPKTQKVGDNLDEITFDMQLHSRFCNPEAEFNNLLSAKSNGDVLPLITGSGEYLGDFCVQEIGETVLHTDASGAIILSKLNVTLIEHASGGDPQASAAKAGAFANAGNSPVSGPFAVTAIGQGIKAMSSLNASVTAVDGGNVTLYQASRQPTAEPQKLAKAQRQFEKASKAMDEYDQAAQDVKDHFDDWTQVQGSIAATNTYLNNTLTAIKAGDTSSAINAGQSTRGALDNIIGGSVNIATLTAIRRI
jgi:phage protein U